jgi:hypothetical protein
MDRRSFWSKVGGRKGFHGYLAYLTLTVMAFALDASFGEYAIGILAALGITSSAIAYEDRATRAEVGPEDK